jgi:hypothetical protein
VWPQLVPTARLVNPVLVGGSVGEITVDRTIGLTRATVKIGMANLTYNLARYVWHEGRTAPA